MAKDDLTQDWEQVEGRSKQEASAELAGKAYAAYISDERVEGVEDAEPDQGVLSDLLGDLMHFAVEHELDFDEALRIAAMHYDHEHDDPDELLSETG